MQAEDIKQLIEAGIPGARAEVAGEDGTHFEACIVSDAFEGRTQVQRHQLVYRALGEKMGREIHALSMQTLTPQQWEQGKGLRAP